MSYSIVTIRSEDDTEDDWLYPQLDDHAGSAVVALTPDDGHPTALRAKGLMVHAFVGGSSKKLLELRDVDIELHITDTRVVIGCDKYDKGGGWVGFGAGAFFALAANGVSKARAAYRRKGKALVGQIRYPWLDSVGGSPKEGWLSEEELRVVARRSAADGGGLIGMTLTLNKREDSMAVAQEIAHRAAAWHLSHADRDSDNHDALDALSHAPRLTAAPKAFVLHRFPAAQPATAAVADATSSPGAPTSEDTER